MTKALRIFAAILALFMLPGLAVSGERVLAVKRTIYPGQEVMLDMVGHIVLRRKLRSSVRVMRDPAEIVGKIAQRTILPRRPIPIASVREPYVVEAGVPVRLSYVHGGLSIVMTGMPLTPGVVGDTVRVRNTDSGRTVSGVVLPDGSVRVEPL